MSAPSPCYVTQTPQREFAGAKLQKKMRYANKFVKLKQKRPQKCDRNAKSFY